MMPSLSFRRIVVALLVSSALYGAGQVSQSLTSMGPPGIPPGFGNVQLVFTWRGDAADGSVPLTQAQLSGLPGGVQGMRILQVEIVPGTPAPTNNYAVALIDPFGADIMAGAMVSLSATAAQLFSASSVSPPVTSFALQITSQVVANAQGKVIVFLGPVTLVTATAGAQGPAGPQGATGAAGPQGATGAAGPQGGGLDPNAFKFTQTPGGTLTGGVAAAVTLTPCPSGVAGTDTTHYLYVSGGTGTAETVLMTGGTCTSGAATGTIIFTPANNHSGAWTIQSATAGMTEALNTLPTTGGTLHLPAGVYLLYPGANTGLIILAANQHVVGSGQGSTLLKIGYTPPLAQLAQAIIYTNAADASVERLTFDGNAITSNLQSIIFADTAATRLTVHNVRIQNTYSSLGCVFTTGGSYHKFDLISIDAGTSTAGCHGLRLTAATETSTYHTVSNVTIAHGAFGVSLKLVDRNVLSNLTLTGDATPLVSASLEGMHLDGTSDNIISNVVSWGRGDSGIVMAIDNGTVSNFRNVFSNVSLSNNKQNGLALLGEDNTFLNVQTFNNGVGCTANQCNGVTCSVVTGVNCVRNRFYNLETQNVSGATSQLYGISLQQAGTGIVDGNEFWYYANGNTTSDYGTTGTVTFTQRRYVNQGVLRISPGIVLDNAKYYAINNSAGTSKNVIGVENTVFTDATRVRSAGGGITFENSAGTNLFQISEAGLVQWVTSAQPACNSGSRGTVWYVAGGAGVKDTFNVCAKDAADAYAWRTIY